MQLRFFPNVESSDDNHRKHTSTPSILLLKYSKSRGFIKSLLIASTNLKTLT